MDPVAELEAGLRQAFLARTSRSSALHERGRRVMPGGDTRTGTFHLPYPLFLERAAGSRIWDVDGNEYLDFLNNFTSLIHGHAHPAIQRAVEEQARRGTVHGGPGELQVRLAEVLCGRVPTVERLRYCNSGTEATLCALRGAKAFTGRVKVMKMEGGYHGQHDQVAVAMAPPYETQASSGLSPGALGEVLLGRMNALEYTGDLIRRHRDELAAVIVEPVMGAAGAVPAEAEFLRGLRRVTEECGVLLVLDEIITLRLGYGGAQEHYGIRPDLTTFGKIIGGGLPVGAFGGRADVMAMFDPTRPGAITHSGTYNGNAATMAAGVAALGVFGRPAVERLNRLGNELRATLNARLRERGIDGQVTGFGSVMQLHFTAEPVREARDAARGNQAALRLMHLAMLAQGIFTASRQMYVLSTVMTDDDLEHFTTAFDAALTAIGPALEMRSPASTG